MSKKQLQDLAYLLAKCVGIGNIDVFATQTMGKEARQSAGNDVGDINAFAGKIVQALHKKGLLLDFIGRCSRRRIRIVS